MLRNHLFLTIFACITCLSAAWAAPALTVHNTSGHRIQVQVADASTPAPQKWHMLADKATVRLPFKHGQMLLCQTPDGWLKAPPYTIGSSLKLRIEEMHIYGAPNTPHTNALMVTSEE